MSSLRHAIEAIQGIAFDKSQPVFHRLGSDLSNLSILLPADGPLADALGGQPPGAIGMGIEDGVIDISHLEKTTMAAMFSNMITPIFCLHFDMCREWLHENGRGDTLSWTSSLNFARVIRNAASHGGKLFFQRPTMPGVEWCGLQYSFADNGKKIIGTEIFFPDLVALLIEIDDDLASLGAPR